MPGNDLIPWLQSFMRNQGALVPYSGASSYGVGPQGQMPGGGTLNYPATTQGAPSMGFPAQGGPDIFGPQGSNVGTGKEVGPWTNPFTEAHINPQTGQPEYVGGQGAAIGPGSGAGGGFNPFSLFGGGNPYARGGLAAAGAMVPTPAETGELPLSMSGARPQHPASAGAMPQPFVQPQHPSTMRYPMWPTPPAPDAPAGSPSATPKPADASPSGPLASPSGQGGIGSDARFPLKRRAGAANLGYYQPTTGNARGATWTPYANPNDPRIYRG